ncbi:CDP-glycerol glycerophosphotransferase family protein [Stenotrophomonas sp. HITSZ_GD]|uniref:CDP-glycerol glycerophosphotransferase family protein n=1 Tax=Stenotrophomonas sp. HITSZ_GD TaxID=3037248 RepID=UPI00240D1E0B|nr:CDP-glycerol glycerophosphotransferase family protein [Stenotrophomonas sp. HITSZ_GD]MDG2526529.1 CDP-glycerol glycerophosphotransferase family protein [Stenotrophomonas sp. HITSZ_GD]
MNAAELDIALEGESTLRLDMRGPCAAADGLRLQPRGRGRERALVAHTERVGDALRARVSVEQLLAAQAVRWDVRLAAGDRDEPLRARPQQGERHFFSTRLGEHGLSAYLSDSAESLVLYSAPRDQHARVMADENARANFPRWLHELPLREDLVLFESFLGKTYAGNPRYLYEALHPARPDLQCVWAYQGNETIPGNPPRVRRGSAEYYRVLAQAKYRVNNVLFPVHGRKPETVYLQTWHGTPLKRLGYDIEVAGPEADARDNLRREAASWSVLLSANAFSSQILPRAFGYDGPVMEAGYPLADALHVPFEHPDARAAALRALGLPQDRRYLLYAPTWRDDQPIGAWRFGFDLQLDLARVSAALAPDQVLLLKTHHLVAAQLDSAQLPDNVIDVSARDDVTELCRVSDILITDYSSVFFDFAVTGRPILFFCYDLDHYAERIRGFYLDVPGDLPGPVSRDTDELIAHLHDLPAITAAHAERYAAFRARFCERHAGATARVIEQVFGARA